MTLHKPKSSPFHRLINSTKFKNLTPDEQFHAMLQHKTIDQLIAIGQLYDVEGARQELGGVAGWTVRRYCREGMIGHIVRPGGQYLFLPSQLKAGFKSVSASR